MGKWFFISIIILALSFSVIYFMMQSPDTPDLAPGSGDACPDPNLGLMACTGELVCKKSNEKIYISTNSDGSCPAGYPLYIINDIDQLSLCAIADSLFKNSVIGSEFPVQCNKPCDDKGIKPFNKYIQGPPPSCCISGIERICKYNWLRQGILYGIPDANNNPYKE
ncbi:hypothetical protein EXS72_02860 [Candidatus Pacearchaeota archaeon]|nr:hypothetical protein [Candidatus Pacearchaeota archaeon]